MKRIFIIITSLLLIAIGISCSAISSTTGNISGTVLWRTQGGENKVVIGVTVNVWGWKDGKVNKIASGFSDGLGQYSISNVPAGSYNVTCHQDAGSNVVQKNWLLEVKVESGQSTQLNLTIDNALPPNTVLPAEYR